MRGAALPCASQPGFSCESQCYQLGEDSSQCNTCGTVHAPEPHCEPGRVCHKVSRQRGLPLQDVWLRTLHVMAGFQAHLVW